MDIVAELDEDTSFLDASESGDEDSNDTVTWENIDVDRDDSITLVLRVRVRTSADDGQQLRFEARTDCDANDEERTLVTDDKLPPPPPGDETGIVTVDKSADRREVQPGSVVSYTITIRNSGQGIARDLVIEDRFTAGALTVEDAAGGQSIGDGVTWRIASLGPNETQIIRYRVRISGSMRHGQIVTNTVTVTGLGFDRPATDTEQVHIIQQLPQTGFMSFTADSGSRNIRLAESTTSGDASLPFVIWSTIITMGMSVGSVLGRRFFII